ncbi:MAG: RHS repeat-associated core domain-containing protein, partial [Bacteroidota bacterium]
MYSPIPLRRALLTALTCLLILPLASAQMEKVWPSWAVDNGFQYVAQEKAVTNAASSLEYAVAGSDFILGFYGQNTTLYSFSGLRFGIHYTGSTLFIYKDGGIAQVYSTVFAPGDVVELRYSGERFTYFLNGTPIYHVDYTAVVDIYPYFFDTVGSGEQDRMIYRRELPATVLPTWQVDGSWLIGANVLERGQDGGMEMTYDGGTADWHLRFQSTKNTDYNKYTVARIWVRANLGHLWMYYRTPSEDYDPEQDNAWTGAYHILSPDEFYDGAKIRLAREGTNVVFYLNGKELRRVHTDANIDLHPIFLSQTAGQSNQIRFTFEERGGMCQDYFYSLSSAINPLLAGAYYPAPAADTDWNHITTRTYDGRGESVCHQLSELRTYYDQMGRVVQGQSKDVQTREVWATETLYDSYGRAAISTLAAPTGDHRIAFKNDFVRNDQGVAYGPNDFEGVKLNAPNPVGTQANTLGWWYSNQNDRDEWQGTTEYPYVRTEYSELTGAVRRQGGPGDEYRMGSGHETVRFSMPAGNELRYVFGNQSPLCLLRNDGSFDPSNQLLNYCGHTVFSTEYLKHIGQDADGKQVVTFTDGEGNEVARAVSGSSDISTDNLKSAQFVIPATDFLDIHITRRNAFLTTVAFSGTGRDFSIYNLETDQLAFPAHQSASALNLSEGFYRITNHNGSASLTLDYDLNYYDFSLNIHDLTGQLVATVAPNDVRYDATSTPTHQAFSLYRYDSRGRLLWERTPDQGRSYFYYNSENRTRFSQDAQQRLDQKFSYYKYDATGRVIESGERSGIPVGGLETKVDDPSFPNDYANIVDDTYQLYDAPDPAFSWPGGYVQKFTEGRLSKTWNDQEAIWYSYDAWGRVDWIARGITGTALKITEYQYDLLGQVTTVVFQQNASDEVRTHYVYDRKGQITAAGNRHSAADNDPATNHVRYRYGLDGELEQRILGDGLESQTFAYTLQGQLKAINPEDMVEVDLERGGRHAFSMALHYHVRDYRSANGSWLDTHLLPSTSAGDTDNRYSGLITGTRWKTRAASGGTDLSGHFGYDYHHNYRNELEYSRLGTIEAYSAPDFDSKFSFTTDYFTYAEYDPNGNIQRLIRFAADDPTCPADAKYMDNLTYHYDYSGGKNRLRRISDAFATDCIPGQLTNQTLADTYAYNAKGQLVVDYAEGLFMEYDRYGRVVRVRDGIKINAPLRAEYFYGPDGQRVRKTVYDGSNWSSTWYAYDGSSLQGIYENSSDCACHPALVEVPLMGGTRIGMGYWSGGAWSYHYELADHLGNVRAVLREDAQGLPEVLDYADYYPRGWKHPGRQFSTGQRYRYAYQGQYAEADGETGWAAFDLRSYDGRVGRWMTVDPYREFWSPYLAMGNQPHMLTDPTGGSTNPFDPNCGGSPTLNLDRPLEDFNISIPEGLDRPVITAS